MVSFKVGDKVQAHDDIDDLDNIYGVLTVVGDGGLGRVRWNGMKEDELVSLDELKPLPEGESL